MIPFFIFVLGLIFGSFLNAVIFRLKAEESFITGRSKCPECKHVLGTKDLWPILSWLTLRGKCRYCRKPISVQYPLVELATGLIFLVIYLNAVTDVSTYFLNNLQLGAWLIYSLFLILIFVYDYKYYLILDKVVWPAAIIALVLNLFIGYSWWQMLLAGIVGGGFFLLQFLVSQGKWIGGGDIRLGFLMGIMLSWPNILAALMIAYFVGSIVGLGLIAVGRKKLSSQIPFGTFLSLATLVTMLYGNILVNWYLNFLYA